MFIENSNQSGSLEVICGSMFSGKTEELIRRIKRAKIAGLKLQIFKPLTDTRYSKVDVVSHDKNAINSVAVASSAALLQNVDHDTKVVGIDEAQFFDLELPQVCNLLINRGIRVIVAGLDMDYLGRPFGPMGNLMCIATDVLKVHAICTSCGRLAQYSHRLSLNDSLVQLGEKNLYEPLCRECYEHKKNGAIKKNVHDAVANC